jgi:hypothetical protein
VICGGLQVDVDESVRRSPTSGAIPRCHITYLDALLSRSDLGLVLQFARCCGWPNLGAIEVIRQRPRAVVMVAGEEHDGCSPWVAVGPVTGTRSGAWCSGCDSCGGGLRLNIVWSIHVCCVVVINLRFVHTGWWMSWDALLVTKSS